MEMITQYFLIQLLISLSNAFERYPYVLPKCCSKDVAPYQVRNSRTNDKGLIGPCGSEGSEVVLLPKQFFPAMPDDLEYVEVKLRNLVDGLKCDEGSDDSDIIIDFEELECLETKNVGRRKVFEDYGFSGDNLLVPDGKMYSSTHFCISSTTVNKTGLDIKTCRQECSARNPCIPRCCRGHQSILTSRPTFQADLESFCSTPSLEKDGWNPLTSGILEVRNRTHFYQVRPPYTPEGNCRLLHFTKQKSQLTFLENGKLQVNLENSVEVVSHFCIDGINLLRERNSTGKVEDDCEAPGEGEVVVVYVCSPEETSPPTTTSSEDVTLPTCSCLTQASNEIFHLPLNLFPEHLGNDTKTSIAVRLGKSGSLNCPEKYEDSTLEFKEQLFTEDNSLILNGYSFDKTQFCVRSLFDNGMTVRTCKEECSVQRPCVNRCCSGNSHIDLEALALKPHDEMKIICVASNNPDEPEWSPSLYRSVDDISSRSEEDEDIRLVFRQRQPYIPGNCAFVTPTRQEKPEALSTLPFKLMTTGDLLEKMKRKTWEKVNLGDYCMEPFMRRGVNGSLELSKDPEDFAVWRCWRAPAVDSGYIGTHPELMASLYFTFSVFYVLIAVVYILRKDKEPVFRWSIVCCSFSMTLTFLCFGYNRISFLIHSREEYYLTTCAVIGMFSNFVYLNGFSWITVLCFDIWLTLTFLRPGEKSIKRLWLYIAFTLTLPAAVVGTGVALDFFYLPDPFSDVLVPQYGVVRCLFEPTDAALPYLYGPLAVLTSINFILFFATVVKLCFARHSSEISKSKSDSRETHKKMFLLYFKLFLLMGLLWVMETLSWVFTELNKPVPLWAIVVETVTLFQPAFVFFFLVWNKETKKYIGAKYPRTKGVIDFFDRIEKRVVRLLLCGRCRGRDGGVANGATSSGTNDTPLSLYPLHRPHYIYQ